MWSGEAFNPLSRLRWSGTSVTSPEDDPMDVDESNRKAVPYDKMLVPSGSNVTPPPLHHFLPEAQTEPLNLPEEEVIESGELDREQIHRRMLFAMFPEGGDDDFSGPPALIFSCNHCAMKFATPKELKKHEENSHPMISDNSNLPLAVVPVQQACSRCHQLFDLSQTIVKQRCAACIKELTKQVQDHALKWMAQEIRKSTPTLPPPPSIPPAFQPNIDVNHAEDDDFSGPPALALSCNLCDKNFATPMGLKEHEAANHPIKKRKQTEEVDQPSSKKQKIGETVGPTPRYQCPHCTSSYAQKRKLHIHLRDAHSASRYEIKEVLEMESSSGDEDESFSLSSSSSSVTSFVADVHALPDLPLFKCTKCDKAFKLQTFLTRHIATAHTDIPKLLPTLPPTQPVVDHNSLGEIQEMLEVNESDDDKESVSPSSSPSTSVVANVRTLPVANNPANAPLKCPLCVTTFKNRQYLRQHVSNVHASEHDFPCHLCSRIFIDQVGLSIHLKRSNAHRINDNNTKLGFLRTRFRRLLDEAGYSQRNVIEFLGGPKGHSPSVSKFYHGASFPMARRHKLLEWIIAKEAILFNGKAPVKMILEHGPVGDGRYYYKIHWDNDQVTSNSLESLYYYDAKNELIVCDKLKAYWNLHPELRQEFGKK